jgi:hypothetical protein
MVGVIQPLDQFGSGLAAPNLAPICIGPSQATTWQHELVGAHGPPSVDSMQQAAAGLMAALHGVPPPSQ